MQKAKVGKRIAAFLLDSIVIAIVIAMISSLFEDPVYLQKLTEIETAYLNGNITYAQYYDAVYALEDPNEWIKNLISIIFTAGYFIVLPLFWSEQTLGRKATKIKVVQENYQPVKAKHLIIREGLSQLLFSTVFAFIANVTNVTVIQTIADVVGTILPFVLLIGLFTMLGSSKTTLYDCWSKTLTVSAEKVVKEDELDIVNAKPEDIIDL